MIPEIKLKKMKNREKSSLTYNLMRLQEKRCDEEEEDEEYEEEEEEAKSDGLKHICLWFDYLKYRIRFQWLRKEEKKKKKVG